jgi:hypothetical protein
MLERHFLSRGGPTRTVIQTGPADTEQVCPHAQRKSLSCAVNEHPALSRYLSALDQKSVESLRTLFQEDVLARTPFADPGGIKDRCEQSWLVADVDGTRQLA